MVDPVTTATLWVIWGQALQPIIADACKDHLKGKLGKLFSSIEDGQKKDELQAAYETALAEAYTVSLESLLNVLKAMGYSDDELREYEDSLKAFIEDDAVADELLAAIKNPLDEDRPNPDVLRQRWQALGNKPLPFDQLWVAVVGKLRKHGKEESFLSEELRDVLNARNQDEIKNLLRQIAGVPLQARQDKYADRMRVKYAAVDLANMMPAHAEDPGRLVIRDVFVPQIVREDPPPVELPKDLAERLAEKKHGQRPSVDDNEELDAEQLDRLRKAYVSRPTQPVLDVIAAPGNRLCVLTGEAGSGKSTLLRYLLLGVLDPPRDAETGDPLPWTRGFQEAFPLLIELRDYYATTKQEQEVDNFLDYANYLGRNDHWAVHDVWLDQQLKQRPTLVMFDGVDEIFDAADRERVMQQIAGFSQAYPRARIIVTSRPHGYQEKKRILSEAGFKHFGIQDLDDSQIESFIRGWFALVFPRQATEREQRIERVLSSIKRSRSIRLLAGNPMLLTIMALLAREQELPRERAGFYEKAAEVLCHHWDANRHLDLPDQRDLNAEDKKDLLRRIAMRMQASQAGLKGNFIHENDLEDEIQSFLVEEQWQTDAAEARKAARRMIDQLRKRNYILCLRGPHLYGFVHRTFLEYLTAADIVRQFSHSQTLDIKDLTRIFDEHCRDAEWQEVLRLICGQIDERFVGDIASHLATRTDLDEWDGESALDEVTLAVYCIAEVRNPGRIQETGRKVFDRVCSIALKALDRSEEFVDRGLIPACREVGDRWPGLNPDHLRERAVLKIDNSPRNIYGSKLWVNLLILVAADRTSALKLAITNRGIFNGMAARFFAIRAMAEKWPDQDTRQFLTERAVRDENFNPRRAALQALAEKWPDDDTRHFLTERAVEDDHHVSRRAALQVLAEKWPDECTRDVLIECALQDEGYDCRGSALRALAEKWPDENTRQLLTERARQDDSSDARRYALQALAEKWTDENTRQFLTERAAQDDNEAVRAVAAHLLGDSHSAFGGIMLTRDLDGVGPFLDPLKPVPQKHITSAARRVGVDPDDIDAQVASLNEFLGWDVRRGAAAAKG